MKTSQFTAVEQLIKTIIQINIDLGHLRNTGTIKFHEVGSGQIRLDISGGPLFTHLRDGAIYTLQEQKIELVAQLAETYNVSYDGE